MLLDQLARLEPITNRASLAIKLFAYYAINFVVIDHFMIKYWNQRF